MNAVYSPDYLVGLVRELCHLNGEAEWVEFKRNKADPQEIGEYISALANAASLNGKVHAYMLWGIDDATHDIVGTSFKPATAKKGGEALENWLRRLLEPESGFQFEETEIDGRQVILLEIECATRSPVSFQGTAYIRVGEIKKPLRKVPDRERELWRILNQKPFETLVAAEHLGSEEVLLLLDYVAYFDLLKLPPPANREMILDALSADGLIQACPAGGWNIMNLGAILLARRLADFPGLERKEMRVIQYRGTDRLEPIQEKPGVKGYAVGFNELVDHINGHLPRNEIIKQAVRETVSMYPDLAVRELVANALIHQDFLVTGAGPMVEIFEGRIEITNPGKPLVSTDRFVDTPPTSRNNRVASLMRRFRLCEERGSGIDKVVYEVELYQLPAPLFEIPGEFTRVVLFAHQQFKDMDKSDRIRACYLHACLCYVTRRKMTNATLRERFGVADRNSADISRVLKEALKDGKIVIKDESVGARGRAYLPFWAKGNRIQ